MQGVWIQNHVQEENKKMYPLPVLVKEEGASWRVMLDCQTPLLLEIAITTDDLGERGD